MSTFTQARRPLAVSTPLGPDALLLEKISGTENVSDLFRFQLDMLADAATTISFERVLGQKMVVRLDNVDGQVRYFSGICSQLRQGPIVRGDVGAPNLVRYHAELVPQFWLLTQRVQSRIFQQQNVVQILKTVLHGLDVKYTLGGDYLERNYCVQYQESDFDFASRLMEEEGIHYFFEHEEDGHHLVLSDMLLSHPHLPTPSDQIDFEDSPSQGQGGVVTRWEKAQRVAPTRFIVRDRHFEMPSSNLEANVPMEAPVQVGKVQHRLSLDGFNHLDVYQHPGDYAHRFDGVSPGGGAQPDKLQNLFKDNEVTAQLAMERSAAQSLRIDGDSNCAALTSGFLFTLKKHPQAQGDYLLTRIEHEAYWPGFRSGVANANLDYSNRFESLPKELKYRPPTKTARPRIHGTQTATVSGPDTGEIFTDKYGRVKVKFHWDRQQESASDTSCWIRVMQPWAGQGWGSISLPRVGQEVVVDFLDGNPDRPLILGSVYNSEQMPPYALPDKRMVSGTRSRSLLSNSAEHYNEVRMDDTAGSELLNLQAQKDMKTTVENNYDLTVDNNDSVTVKNDYTTKVDNNTTWTFGDSPLTMNLVLTWNNIEINKLTRTVVSTVSHADVTAMKVDIDALHFTGVAGLSAEIDTLKFEKVITKSWESCGAKSLSTTLNLTETVGRDRTENIKNNHTVTVGNNWSQTVKKDLLIKGKFVDISTSVPGTLPNDQMLTVRSKNEVNIDAGNKINMSCGSEGSGIGFFLDESGTALIIADSITLQAKEQIILRAPQVITQGESDEMPYHPQAYEMVENMLRQGSRPNEVADILSSLVEEDEMDAKMMRVLVKFYALG